MSDSKTVMGHTVSKAEFEQMKAMMAEQGAELMAGFDDAFGGSDEPIEVRHSTTPLPEPATGADLQRAVALAKHGYRRSWFDNDQIEVDLLFVPNAETVEAAVEWSGGVESGSSRFDAEKGVLTVEVPKDRGSGLTGKLTVSTATELDVITFRPGDDGTTERGYTLTKLSGHAVGIGQPPGGATPVLAALDSDGRRLAWSSNSSNATHKDGRQVWELEWDEIVEANLIQAMEYSFCGTIAELRLYVPKATATATGEITVVDQEHQDDVPAGIRLARSRPLDFRELTADEVRDGIRVEFGRSESMMEAGQPKVVVQLPLIDNSAYASVEFGAVELTGVDHYERCRGILSHETFQIEERFEGAEEGLTEIRGTAKVRYPLRVEALRFEGSGKAASGRAECAIDGHEVKLSYDRQTLPGLDVDVASFAPPELERIVGLHASGELLQPLSFQGTSSSGDSVTTTRRFWGPVAAVEVRHPTEFIEIEVPFSLRVS